MGVIVLLALSAGAAERGFPLITIYPPQVHRAGPQTFDLTQDARGILYFGNLHGLVTYDGAWWRLRVLPDEQVAVSVAADARGRVALGLINDFGYLEGDARGSSEYRSLLSALPPEKRNFGDVRAICTSKAGFLFVAERRLLTWNGSAVGIAGEFDPKDAPRGCHADGGGILLRGPKGLQRFDPVTSRVESAGITDRYVLLALRGADGKLIVAIRDGGLETLSDGVASPFAPEASAWLKGKVVSGGVKMPDGRLVLSTLHHGLIVLAPDGAVEQTIGEADGLPDAIINEIRVDRDGSLWLAMEGPLVRIDLGSPVTLFDVRSGLRGSAGDVIQHNGRLYAASSHGIYSIDDRGRAQQLEMRENAWRLLSIEGDLLVGTTKGIYRILDSGAVERLIETPSEVYDMSRSPSDPARVWIAHGDGIGSIRRAGGVWLNEGIIEGTPADVSSVVEHRGVLWAGTVFDGIARVDASRSANARVQTFGEGEMNVFLVAGRPVFVRATGSIVEIGSDGKLRPDRLLGHISAPRGFFVVAEDHHGDLWINSTPPRRFERSEDGRYAAEGKPLVSVTAADIQTLRSTPDGVMWFASDSGLFRYERPTADAQVAPQPAPLIRRVVVGENRLLFGGTASGGDDVELQHDFGRIRIEFAPASYRPGVSYQYRLDPIDSGWSEWIDEPFIDYTTLEANDYAFRLRARGPAMVPTEETDWSFSVLPPWYRTGWAWALWGLVAVSVVVAVIRVRTAALRRQADRLRANVESKTAELQEAVILLEEANARLEALSMEDDLTGIANRRHFERALADEWNRARRHEHPLSLILLDLDYFKDLNDRRGHPAGDECLRRVGAFLAEAVRRSGEVVARYGGEEFAILLPGVPTEGAVQVAESLREGIERLDVPYGTGSGRRVTASCGVAAVVPQLEMAAETLVASADRALYTAKHSGRNCIRVADETTTGTWLRGVSA